ncbi:3-deoxy-manno-octulosonate cytidylyltransferase [Neolewinella aurantiaca]|uniref:3-deoxy-manno-octulosonate cytidylyltransferase n=1 Tax=Neolewinella aurantiaca TaxID=2602767 RepID=A0A5C7FGU9_9BACT|nr:3-deoxy-manno-octulosonate cytidylyltransferase [Neolewinella aurantiaca]TXF90437.1 3-deoxy-manno-octulosonate cytidylyltransferase [Neolewinella aurantiaca]
MTLAIIPARYNSTRFPGKPLADMAGKTMIQRVYERVSSTEDIHRVVVATDDQRIFDHVLSFGGEVMMTRNDHPSGTDRVAEVAAHFPEATIIVNVQGDEPFINPLQIAAVVAPFADPEVAIATLARPITQERELLSPNVVKVVRSSSGRALYFSRHAIPFLRDVPVGKWIDQKKHLQHLGLYAYRSEILPELTSLPKGELEGDESLEQLRWLAAGYSIQVGLTDLPAIGIDTPEDLKRAVTMLSKE